jgi:hypothetical protein
MYIVERQYQVRLDRKRIASRGIVATSASSGSCTTVRPPAAADGGHAGRAVLVGAGQQDAGSAGP